MSRRKLTSEEVELWHQVVEHAERLHPGSHSTPPALPLPKPKPAKQPQVRSENLLEVFELGSKAKPKPQRHALKPTPGKALAASPLQMDEKAFRRMKRGKLKPEGKLDLHGMRVDSAHPALTRFILSAQASGKRLVLVVTGKGKDRDEPGPIPVPRGILRHHVPQWLALPPLAQAVLQVSQSHVTHGGEGAYYVYLRRTR
ncbi:Smr/MutS family protein [Phaeobacter sp. 11ANDIMAR09]|uniref:Smr/MutS family protein n=1 Tax=Phaeobacter sp. 11ANDIMAR09 TaxID=1225647 RepID=UPI0006C8AFA8|nr:Smr/MutS family protein [Phaeobacter sp. 11ANDIMAR09]KPD14364.1 DNA mismatch repair protein MutS [Phaeobacter sp. 11ANDIMAR09]OIQ34333.1 MAG: DNA mismatch repair protein MutS [Roseobacter sp. MedPE-SWchi]